jgi:predicted AlkP superfamily phosphohydrolase/phosphomutase
MPRPAVLEAARAPEARRSRTIVIGLDAFDLRLARRWGSAGALPCLERLFAGCPLVRLDTPSRVIQGTVWPSLLTGASPGRHGLYLQQQLQNGTYAIVETFADHVRLKRFYEHMEDAGLRCGLADLPSDRPAKRVRGVQVVEWSTEFAMWRYETRPRSFARYIRSRIGINPMTSHWNSGDSQDSHTRLCSALETSTRMKAQLGEALLARPDLDLVFLVFGEAHKAGHWLWKYQDEGHPNHEPSASELRQGLLNCYKQIDRALAQLTALVRPEDNLIVLSDHGMQPAYRGDHLVDLILERLGYLTYLAERSPGGGTREADSLAHAARRVLGRGKSAVKRLAPRALIAAVNRRKNSFPTVDWRRTRAFSLPTDRNSHIRLNLEGREPQGVVKPGAAYESMLDEIEAAFRSLINPRTGGPAVEEVFRVRSLFPGERSEDLPDLSILWSAEAPIDEVTSPRTGLIRHSIRELRSGNHRAEGFLLARGPRFKQGAQESQGHILQIAPTLLHLHGLAMPEQYEMGPLRDILR